ncbi:MAG: leucyl aminopeptidase [Actinomycetota bacterium]|nr:leucyl aminopeptidase [Actinomycetota bacterium]
MPRAPQITSTTDPATGVTCDALVVGAYSKEEGIELTDQASEVDGVLGGVLAKLADAGFKAKLGEVAIVPSTGNVAATSVAVVGLGKKEKLGASEMRRAAGNAGRRLADRSSIAWALPASADGNDLTEVTAEGSVLGSYRFTTYKSDAKPSKLASMTFVGGDAAAAERGVVKAEAATLARDLINEPASTLTPTALADRAKELAHSSDLVAKVWGPAELQERGFGGLLGVSRGSEEEPRFIQLRYVPAEPKGKIVLVGKGVTYDTGGYSLKPPGSMEQMKTDMSGAATVIGVMSVLGRLGINLEVVGLVPATENMVSGKAIKPGDVITHYGGKTTEVMNTDAEGRLILADALVFASEQEPDAVVDLATLTGSMVVALGKKATGVFSNNDELWSELRTASDTVGELTWRMPLWSDMMSELDSEIADYKNVGSRYGGAITAAVFLQEFVSKDVAWAHLDIAGPARSDNDKDDLSKGGSGVGVRTLIEWLQSRSA